MNEAKEKKLKIVRANAVEAYEGGSADLKLAFEKLWPGEFKPVIITDIIHDFEDVLKWHGIDENAYNIANMYLESDEKAYRHMKLISRCLNELKPGERLDPSESWYYPVFNRNAGSGFACVYYDGWASITIVGERLSFKSSTLAIYAGNTFPEIYKPFMLDLSGGAKN